MKRDTDLLTTLRDENGWNRTKAYLTLSGPGWLQSALKLGAGSMSGSLYLGVLSGFSLLWLQPMAMVLGIVMLSAIGYVVMSTGERPFKAINEHVSPVLGWGWAMAALAASVLWAVPQYSLAIGVVQQNLLPGWFGPAGFITEAQGKGIIALLLLIGCTGVAWSFDRRGTGIKVFDWILKGMVMLIVICFVGVVFRLGISPDGLDWAAIRQGFIPDFGLLFSPAATFQPLLEAVAPEHREYWRELLVDRQRDVMVASAAASAGVNGTFLFAYTLLRRGWGREFRIFSKVDLVVGMFIPFALATSCVVIAGASQFHTLPQVGFIDQAPEGQGPSARQLTEFNELLAGRLSAGGEAVAPAALQAGLAGVSEAERRLAATLVTRDAFGLAASIEPFTGPVVANIFFGLGVLGMCVSSIILQMLVAGFVVCEVLDRPHQGWTLRIGSLAAAASAFVPFFWTKAYFWLAVPTSVFASMLIPIAYTTFLLMMNQPSLLKAEMPRGKRRVAWNTFMILALTAFSFSAFYTIWNRGGIWGISAVAVFIVAAVATRRTGRSATEGPDGKVLRQEAMR